MHVWAGVVIERQRTEYPGNAVVNHLYRLKLLLLPGGYQSVYNSRHGCKIGGNPLSNPGRIYASTT